MKLCVQRIEQELCNVLFPHQLHCTLCDAASHTEKLLTKAAGACFCSAGLLANFIINLIAIEQSLDALNEQQQQLQQLRKPSRKQHAQLQELLADKRVLLNLALSALDLFRAVAELWPAGSSSRSRSCLSLRTELCSAAQGAVQLAPAVLAASDGRTTYVGFVLEFALQLRYWLRDEVEPVLASISSGCSDSSSCMSDVLQDLLESEGLLQLLAAAQALLTQMLQHASSAAAGSSSSRSTGVSAAAATLSPSAAAAAAATVHSSNSSSNGAASQQLLQAAGISWT
jgi:hypothetical protein